MQIIIKNFVTFLVSFVLQFKVLSHFYWLEMAEKVRKQCCITYLLTSNRLMLKLKQRQVKKYPKKSKLRKNELLLRKMCLRKKNMLLMRTTAVPFTNLSYAAARGGYLTPLRVGRKFLKGNKIQLVPVSIQRKSYLKKTVIIETNRILIILPMHV